MKRLWIAGLTIATVLAGCEQAPTREEGSAAICNNPDGCTPPVGGGGGGRGTCDPSAVECCAAADCPTAPPNAHSTCTANTCGTACNSGTFACGSYGCVTECCFAAQCAPHANASVQCIVSPGIATGSPGAGYCAYRCNAGSHECGAGCVIDSATSCGSSCAVCSAPANASPICSQGQCDYACNAGFQRCGSACIPIGGCCSASDCPAGIGGSGTPICSSDGTCGLSCAPGQICAAQEATRPQAIETLAFAADGSRAFGAGGGSSIFTRDAFGHWTPTSTPISGSIGLLAASSASNLWAYSETPAPGPVYLNQSNGASWAGRDGSNMMTSLYTVDATNTFFVQSGRTYDDGFHAPSSVYKNKGCKTNTPSDCLVRISQSGGDVFWVWAADANNVWAVGGSSMVRLNFGATDATSSQTRLSLPGNNCSAFTGAVRDLWVSCRDPQGQYGLWRGDGVGAWSYVTGLPAGMIPNALFGTGPSDLWAVDFGHVVHWNGAAPLAVLSSSGFKAIAGPRTATGEAWVSQNTSAGGAVLHLRAP